MVNSKTLTKALAERDREDESPDWSSGECDKCGRKDVQVLNTVAHRGFGALCLVCADHEAEDGDLSMLVRGER